MLRMEACHRESRKVCYPRSLEFDAGRCVAGYFPTTTPEMFALAQAGLPRSSDGFTTVRLPTGLIRLSRSNLVPNMCPGENYTQRQIEMLTRHGVQSVPVQLRLPPAEEQPPLHDRSPWSRLNEIWTQATGRELGALPEPEVPVLPYPPRPANLALPPEVVHFLFSVLGSDRGRFFRF